MNEEGELVPAEEDPIDEEELKDSLPDDTSSNFAQMEKYAFCFEENFKVLRGLHHNEEVSR